MIERGATRMSDEVDEYYYRRPLRPKELIPAIAVGVVAGLVGFYITTLFQERTPLRVPPRHAASPRARRARGFG
jgi:H+/Cl- antiporter ClcA